jgi:hypothetical protein
MLETMPGKIQGDSLTGIAFDGPLDASNMWPQSAMPGSAKV